MRLKQKDLESGHAGGRPCGTEGHARDDRDLNIRRQTQRMLGDVAQMLNPLLRGWIEYYGRYTPSALYPLFRYVNVTLLAWAQRKFKRFKAHKVRATYFLIKLAQTRAELFVHWQYGMRGGSPDGSPVRRESHAGICESLAVKSRRPTHQPISKL